VSPAVAPPSESDAAGSVGDAFNFVLASGSSGSDSRVATTDRRAAQHDEATHSRLAEGFGVVRVRSASEVMMTGPRTYR